MLLSSVLIIFIAIHLYKPGKEEVTTKVAKVQFEDQNAGDAFGGKKSKSNKS